SQEPRHWRLRHSQKLKQSRSPEKVVLVAGFFSFGIAFSAYLEWICRADFLNGNEPARPSSRGLQTFEAQRSSPNPAAYSASEQPACVQDLSLARSSFSRFYSSPAVSLASALLA